MSKYPNRDFMPIHGNPSLLDANTGSMLWEDNEGRSKKFVIIGDSLYGYALIRIFSEEQLPHEISHNTHLSDLFVPINNNTEHTSRQFADCSRLISRRFGDIGKWMKKYPECYAGKLSPEDILLLIETIKRASTLSFQQKSEFNFI